MYVFNVFQGLSLALRSHDQIPGLIVLLELCIIDENSEDLQSHDGLCDENAEEVHNLHYNLQSHDGRLHENAEEVHNLQSPDEKNVFLTAIRTLSPWRELVHRLQSPDEKQQKKSIGATIRIGQEIWSLSYAGFFTA